MSGLVQLRHMYLGAHAFLTLDAAVLTLSTFVWMSQSPCFVFLQQARSRLRATWRLCLVGQALTGMHPWQPLHPCR